MADRQITDRTIAVVGATGFVGSAVAAYLHAAGARILAVGRNTERLVALAARLGPDRVSTLSVDLGDDDATRTAAGAYAGELDAVVALVGGWYVAEDAVDAPWDRVTETLQSNLVAHVVAARSFAPTLRPDRDPTYIALNGIASHFPCVGSAAISIAGAGQRMLFEVLAAEEIGRTVRFHELVVDTPILAVDALAGATTPAHSTDDVGAALLRILDTPELRGTARIELLPG